MKISTCSTTVAFTFLLAAFVAPSTVWAQGKGRGKGRAIEKALAEAGTVDGAIWRFSLEPAKGNPHRDVLKGAYRISDLVAYQPSDTEGEEDRRIGSSNPGPRESRTTIFEVDGLKARKNPRDRNEAPVELKGKAVLKPVKPGEVEGLFVASDGYHWTMKCSRIRE